MRCLGDAVRRCLRSGAAVFALLVDAKNDQAEAFYRHHGFVPFGSQPKHVVLPRNETIVQVLAAKFHKRRRTSTGALIVPNRALTLRSISVTRSSNSSCL